MTSEQLPTTDQTITLSLKTTYVQKEGTINERRTLLNIMSLQAQSDTNIDFTKGSSSTNGEGVYQRNGTNIYYYRGAVTNNNVLFANFCWKIVRSTETGGIKLIYNGKPSNGTCDNTGTDSQIKRAAYNTDIISPTYAGYMYGSTVYSRLKFTPSNTGYIYGNDVTYSNGKYTLKTTMTSTTWSNDYKTIATKYHYTCFSTGSSCTEVYYITDFSNSTSAYVIQLSGESNIETAKTKMFTSTTDTKAKTVIDTWYQSNMTNYTSQLEDAVWCSDRSIYAGPLKSKDTDSSTNMITYFGSNGRQSLEEPSLNCINDYDKFTVSSNNGNGKLTYPVALLTADEASLAGINFSGSKTSYLYTGQDWWLLSPSAYGYYTIEFMVNSSGDLDSVSVDGVRGFRPAIVLKSGMKVEDGTDGTTTNPYVVVLEQ